MSITWTNKSLFGDSITFSGGAATLTNADNITISATGTTKSITLSATGDIVLSPAGIVKVPNDIILTVGTTTTNAETKITFEFDETTTGIGLFRMGDTSNPQVLNTNPGAAVIGSIVNILHSAGAGDCNDLISSYDKVSVSGDGDAGITIVGHASRAYVGITGGSNNSVVDECYGSQPWAKHEGTGAITAMSGTSAKLDVSTDNFTATTVNAGHFHIEGAATVTGQFDGVMIEVYGDVTSMDSVLNLTVDNGAAVTNFLNISGTTTNLMFGTDGTAPFGATRGTPNQTATCDGSITVLVGSKTLLIPLFNAVTIS